MEARAFVEKIQAQGFFLIITGMSQDCALFSFVENKSVFIVPDPSFYKEDRPRYTMQQVERIIKLKAFL